MFRPRMLRFLFSIFIILFIFYLLPRFSTAVAVSRYFINSAEVGKKIAPLATSTHSLFIIVDFIYLPCRQKRQLIVICRRRFRTQLGALNALLVVGAGRLATVGTRLSLSHFLYL